MFDDLRKSANDQSFPEDIDEDLEPLLTSAGKKKGSSFNFGSLNILGLSAFQRFILSALLFLLVVVFGIMLVLITSSTLVP